MNIFVIKYLKHILTSLGLKFEGGIGVRMGSYRNNIKYKADKDRELKKLSFLFKDSIYKGNNQNPSIRQAFTFKLWQTRAVVSKYIYPIDYKYWYENGWIGADYFYQTRVNIIPKVIFKIFKKRIISALNEFVK